MNHQGRALGASEEERRKKISAARILREKIKRGEAEALPGTVEIPDEQVRRRSHDQEEIADLEVTYGLTFDHWLTVGGPYLYDFQENGRSRSTPEDAGLKVRVPVFKLRKEKEKEKVDVVRTSDWH